MEAIGPNTYNASGLGWGRDDPNRNYAILYDVYEQYRHNLENTSWEVKFCGAIIGHEVGHCLGLQHPWSDLISDTYSPDVGSFCEASIDPDCSNNLIGGSKFPEYLSPLQIAKARKYLLTTWRSREVENNYQAFHQQTGIQGIEIWDKPRALYGGITIESGHSLEINCRVYLSKQHFESSIYVYGDLYIDGGEFTNSLNYNSLTHIMVRDGGYLELEATEVSKYRISVEPGGTLKIKENNVISADAEIVVNGNASISGKLIIDGDFQLTENAKIRVNSGGELCVVYTSSLELENIQNNITLSNGSFLGCIDGTICYTKPNLIPYTVNGSIIDENIDQYVQNINLHSVLNVRGRNIFVGSNVDPESTQGLVTVNQAAELRINCTGETTITKDFEVKPGATLEVR